VRAALRDALKLKVVKGRRPRGPTYAQSDRDRSEDSGRVATQVEPVMGPHHLKGCSSVTSADAYMCSTLHVATSTRRLRSAETRNVKKHPRRPIGRNLLEPTSVGDPDVGCWPITGPLGYGRCVGLSLGLFLPMSPRLFATSRASSSVGRAADF
jgi:hypothetical protein